jgi:ribosomal protein S18 acetylase RimI-like enzyme
MTDHPHGSEPPTGITAAAALRWDAQMLQDTMLEAIRTSPDSFIMTEEEVKARSLDSWIKEIRSSTWAVAQQNGQVVGIVAGKRPDSDADAEDEAITRYIESVWIDPGFRGQRLGERLIKYLLGVEYQKNQRVRHFRLWVFPTNSTAVSLYERMGFAPTPEVNEHEDKTEVKYRLDFDSTIHGAVVLAVNEAIRRDDRRQYGVIYRVLGEPDSP